DAHHRQIAAADAQRRARVLGDARPALPAVVGAVEAEAGRRGVVARVGGADFDEQAARAAGRDGNVYLRQVRRQPGGELLPGVTAVDRLVQPAHVLVLVLVLPRPEPRLPQPGIDDVRVGGIDSDRRAAGVGIAGQNPLPADAAIERAVDAALGIGTVGVAEHRGEQAVRLLGIHGELGDLLPVAQAEVGPGAPGVVGAVDAVADRQVRAAQPLTAADVHDVGVGGGHGDGADRLRRLLLEDRVPGAARVVGLPYPAIDRTDVEHVRLARHAR